MAKNEPLDFRQDRRAWLKTSAAALGAVVLPVPAISSSLEEAAPALAAAESTGRFFTPGQHALVEELAEAIIPADSHSGGAKSAGVADYIEQVVGTSVNEGEKGLWKEGLRLIELMCQHRAGKSFVDSSAEDRLAILTTLSDHADLTDLPEIQFFHELKRLTVRGYYTSKIGIHDELEYQGNKVSLEFTGCEDPS